MRVVQINSVPHGSTGRVMRQCHDQYVADGWESWMTWGRGRRAESPCEFKFFLPGGFPLDVGLTLLDGRAGFHSKAATKCLLRKLDEIDPDVVHLHNIHGYYLNAEMLFHWLEGRHCSVRWTLHDCWAFTGHCAYFTYAQCDQWKDLSCSHKPCPQQRSYPPSIVCDSAGECFALKKKLFTALPADRMEIITPSEWLSGLVGDSFLSKYPVTVKHNTIDTAVFKPEVSTFRQDYSIGDRFLILGVATPWGERKGFEDFIKLAGDVDERVAIVMVGLTKRQMRFLPANVIGLKRMESVRELAKIYSTADVFFNPTKEDNYPSVLLEAQACGTPVVTYDVGGCAETLVDLRSRSVDGYDQAVRVMMEMADYKLSGTR